MWTHTPLTSALNLELPIVQGPFGGGNSTATLAAAVSNAGGLGSFGAVNLAPEEIPALVEEIARHTSKPFNINLWVPIPGEDDVVPTAERTERSFRHLRPMLENLGLSPPPPTTQPTFERQVEALLRARPPVWSFVMGVPDRSMLAAARRAGIKTIGTATTVDEAVSIADAGADAVVASGSDAGGHRGSFLRPVEESLVGTMSLVPQIAREVAIPVIAAGGIACGRGIAAALALGAHGVQIGTAFLMAPESGAPAVHKAALGQPTSRITKLTRAITGRHARGIENELMRRLEASMADVLPYPAQHVLTSALRRHAGQLENLDHLALWAGQNAASARPIAAADLVAQWVRETDEVLRGTHMQPRNLETPKKDQKY